MMAVNRSFLKRLIWRFSTPKKNRQTMRYSGQNSEPASVELPPIWNKKVVMATEAGHDWLMKEYDLDLRQYGYPCKPLDKNEPKATHIE